MGGAVKSGWVVNTGWWVKIRWVVETLWVVVNGWVVGARHQTQQWVWDSCWAGFVVVDNGGGWLLGSGAFGFAGVINCSDMAVGGCSELVAHCCR